MTYYEFPSGQAKIAYDVSVTNTFAQEATLHRCTAKAAGAACGEPEGRKRSKFLAAMCSAQHIAFFPLIFESAAGFVSADVSRCISRWTTLAEERGGDLLREKWSSFDRLVYYSTLSVA